MTRSLASERLFCALFPNRREAALDRVTGLLYALRLNRLARLTDRGTLALMHRRTERNVRQ